jgi:hypothetical protein
MKTAQPRVLLVTGVLALSMGLGGVIMGCSSKSDDGPAPKAYDEDAKAPSTPSDEPAPSSSGSSGGSSGNPATPQDSGTKDGSAKDGGDAAAPAACLDDSAPAAQPACPGAGGECQMACDSFATDYKKGLSADIRKCLTSAICMNDTTQCADKALAKACADPTAATFCTPMVTGCKASNPADTITQASCEALAKGLTATGRNTLKDCFENDAVCGDCIAKLK